METTPQVLYNQNDIRKKSRIKKNVNKIKVTNSSYKNKIWRKKQTFRKKAKAAIYIGHIPHGFYEDEMNAYFNQFGKVHSVTVARSKRTGRSRGYGIVEFENEEVAKIAAESMNNYLMFNRIIKCRYIPPKERRGRLPIRPLGSILPKVKNRMLSSKNKKDAFAALDKDSYQMKTENKINAFKKFFEERGIDFSFNVDFLKLEDDKAKRPKNLESESLTSSDSKSEDEADEQFGVLEIDESDNDIHFKTPPQVRKVIKRSIRCAESSDATPNKMRKRKEKQGKVMENPRVPKLGKQEAPERKKISKGRKLEKKTIVVEKQALRSGKSKKIENKKTESPNKDARIFDSQKKKKSKGQKISKKNKV